MGSISGYADVVALSAITTTLTAASGVISSVFTNAIYDYMRGHVEYDVLMAMNGELGGFVGITADCCVVTPGIAIIIGILSGWLYLGCSKLLQKSKIDDAEDTITIHYKVFESPKYKVMKALCIKCNDQSVIEKTSIYK